MREEYFGGIVECQRKGNQGDVLMNIVMWWYYSNGKIGHDFFFSFLPFFVLILQLITYEIIMSVVLQSETVLSSHLMHAREPFWSLIVAALPLLEDTCYEDLPVMTLSFSTML